MYKSRAQHRALMAGKDLSGAVAGGTNPGAGSGLATQATDLIVSVCAGSRDARAGQRACVSAVRPCMLACAC